MSALSGVREHLAPSPTNTAPTAADIIAALHAALQDSRRGSGITGLSPRSASPSSSTPAVLVKRSITSLLAFHQRIREGDVDPREAAAFWSAFSAVGLDSLCNFVGTCTADLVGPISQLFGYCYMFAKANAELQSMFSAWVPSAPQQLLRLYELCTTDSGTLLTCPQTSPVFMYLYSFIRKLCITASWRCVNRPEIVVLLCLSVCR